MACLMLEVIKSIVGRCLDFDIEGILINLSIYSLQHREKWWLGCPQIVSRFFTMLLLIMRNLIVLEKFTFMQDLKG